MPQNSTSQETGVAEAQVGPPPAPNSEFELHELVDWLAAELDKVQDSLFIKSHSRGLTFGPTTLTLELSVVERYDAELGKLLLRTTQPGEIGASKLTLNLVPLLRDQILAHRSTRANQADLIPIDSLPGITREELLALHQKAIYAVGDLAAVVQYPMALALLAQHTGISSERLRKLSATSTPELKA